MKMKSTAVLATTLMAVASAAAAHDGWRQFDSTLIESTRASWDSVARRIVACLEHGNHGF